MVKINQNRGLWLAFDYKYVVSIGPYMPLSIKFAINPAGNDLHGLNKSDSEIGR
jgi:hypothetical protein